MNRTELRRRMEAGRLSRRAAELVVRHERAAVELRTVANDLKVLQKHRRSGRTPTKPNFGN